MLEGGNLDGIAAEVARVLDVGVLFTSTDGRERAAALADDHRAAARRARPGRPDRPGAGRADRRDGVRVGAGEVRCLRVAAGGADLARLVCLRADGPISADDVHALERAAAVAALLITREEAVTAVENKYQGDFLRDLLLRRAGDEAYVAEHAETFGWDLRRPVVVVAAEIDPAGPSEEPPTRASAGSGRSGSRGLAPGRRDLDPDIPTVDFSSEVVTLLPLADGRRRSRCAGHDVVRRAVTAVAGDKGGGRRPFSVGRQPGRARRSTSCPRRTPRPAGRSRSAAGCTAAARRRSSTSSGCTG